MERDYVLGTHEEEVERLGLQHRVWQPHVLACWQRAGITVGKRVLDVGAGPGYATADLAEIVGPTGEVVAVERSSNFVEALRERVKQRSTPTIFSGRILSTPPGIPLTQISLIPARPSGPSSSGTSRPTAI